MADPAYLARWGIKGLPDAPEEGARVIDEKAFEKKWLSPSSEPERYNTDNLSSAANAAALSTLEGFPIVGPALRGGAERLGAAGRSLVYGTPYSDELKSVQDLSKQTTEDYPGISTLGGVTGAIAPMVAAGGIPAGARLLGMAGTLPARVGFGGATNALIGGADAAARGGDTGQIATGAGVGGAFGAGAPLVGRAFGAGANYVMRPSNDAVTNRLLTIANQEGIPIGASQASRSPALNKLSQIAGQFPGSGQQAFRADQISAFTRAVGRTFGEDTDLLTPQVMKAAKRRIGSEFDHVAANTSIKVDPTFQNSLLQIVQDAKSVLSESELRPIYNQLTDIMKRVKNGEISGETYQAMTRKGSPLDRLLQSSDKPNVKYYASGIREVLDDGLQRSAPPDLADRLSRARYQYKNLMTVKPLVVKGSPGEVSPLALNQRVNTAFKDRAFSGGGDLGDLAEVGQRFFRAPPDSGTPMGSFVVDNLMRHGNALGTAALAAGLGGGYAMGYDPTDLAKGTAGLLGASLLARGATSVMNRPQAVNRLVSRAPVVTPYLNQPVRNLLLPPPEAQPQP